MGGAEDDSASFVELNSTFSSGTDSILSRRRGGTLATGEGHDGDDVDDRRKGIADVVTDGGVRGRADP